MTQEKDIIHLQRLNSTKTSHIYNHGDQFLLTVGLKDRFGHLGIKISLDIYFAYWGFMEYSIPFINSSTEQFKTNESGIAALTMTYNQYTWPIGSGYGYFKVHLSKANKSALSTDVQFNYFINETTRFSEVNGGIEKILLVENMDLIGRINEQYPFNNSYLSWTGSSVGIIDSTSISQFQMTFNSASYGPLNYRLEYQYTAVSVPFTDLTLNYTYLQSIWDNHTILNQTSLWFLWPGDIKDFYLICAPLKESLINTVTSGWIIMQVLSYERISGPLNGNFQLILQVAILDLKDTLIWLSSDISLAIS